MIINYSHFGDVITFDTTYSTNRDARPLGVFLGLNHHKETVVFGGALLYDETIEFFVWLFETFLEAMSEKKPITIFTDQDATMSVAIKVVMPKTYHALCSRHMWQNAEKHLGHLLKNESQFNNYFLACIYEYDGEGEFLTAWNKMLDKYDVRENKWLIDLFKLKEKWAQAYVKRTFTARIKITQLSESFNANLKDCLRTNLNIVEFFTHFERTEVEEVIALSILECNVSQTHSYVVGVFNQHGKYEVMWNPLDETLSCSSRKFESFGILCRHGLKVLDVLDIKLIPNRYIMKRWRRDEKDGSRKNCTTHNIKPDTQLEYEIYAHDIMVQKKIEDISSGNITSFTQLLMSASTSSASHQGGSSASVALASHLKSISSVVGSNDKIDGAGGLLTQGSIASGGPLTQESVTS
ncbi:protein FAR1-RELATED SEQUENCE 5-like [Quercus robur]|uniref:protein FAR1-RELATED SEQUENCE 5-like n=1 Tax=Quercus robur TaxID=38942 RepID=UPI002163BC4F|nr:protein FAR1-RELATED SEQUENCE 5-like [Quercus robur]